jgi:streptogramin lyase
MGTNDPLVGSEVAGYRIESVLGTGGMSVVYLARHLRLDRHVAFKVLASVLAEDERFRERFIRESRLAASLEHPNIIPIYDAGEAGGLLYIAMRYVDGADLKRRIADRTRLEPDEAIPLLDHVADALDAAHARGLVHRDVKPGNVLIGKGSEPGQPEHVYLSDFGLTKRTSSESGLTESGQFVGTLDYAAPEQFEGKPLGPQTDVYSLACVLYECLAGEVPFLREQQAALMYAHLLAPPPAVTAARADLSGGIDAVVARGMAKDPAARYERAGSLMADARDALAVPGSSLATPQFDTKGGWTLASGRPRRIGLARTLIGIGALAFVIAGLVLATSRLDRGTTGGRTGASPSVPAATGASSAPAAAVGKVVRLNRVSGVHDAEIPFPEVPGSVATGEGAVWVTLPQAGLLARIDPATNRITDRIPVGAKPSAVAVGLGSVWVANEEDGTVSRVSPSTNQVTGTTIDVTRGVDRLVVAFGSVWAGNQLEGIVFRLDPVARVIQASIPVAGFSDFSPGPDVLAVATYAVQSGPVVDVGAIDPAKNVYEVLATPIDASGTSGHARSSLTVDDEFVWLTASVNNSLMRLEIPSGKFTFIPTGRDPAFLADDGIGSIWVANRGDGSVWKISKGARSASAVVTVGGAVGEIAVGEDGVWVAVGGS